MVNINDQKWLKDSANNYEQGVSDTFSTIRHYLYIIMVYHISMTFWSFRHIRKKKLIATDRRSDRWTDQWRDPPLKMRGRLLC